jgi:hypothetical protein
MCPMASGNELKYVVIDRDRLLVRLYSRIAWKCW